MSLGNGTNSTLAAFSCNTKSTRGRRSFTGWVWSEAGRSSGSSNGPGKLMATRSPSALILRRNAT